MYCIPTIYSHAVKVLSVVKLNCQIFFLDFSSDSVKIFSVFFFLVMYVTETNDSTNVLCLPKVITLTQIFPLPLTRPSSTSAGFARLIRSRIGVAHSSFQIDHVMHNWLEHIFHGSD